MTKAGAPSGPTRSDTLGLLLLTSTSFAWGLNWPITKYVLDQWPPFSARGMPGVVGAIALALYALSRGISLRVPRDQWARLLTSAVLNVTLWMAVMGYALLWLSAGEASILAYTMPVWTVLLAWPMLGERLTLRRTLALVIAFAGLVALFGGGGVSANLAKLPGAVLALSGAIGFAVGTILLKKWPIQLPGVTSAAWQVGLGCLPVAAAGLLFERPDVTALTTGGWAALTYMTFVQFCIAYVCWFAALDRLPASVVAIGSLLVPVIGVLVSAIALNEPLGLPQIVALTCTVAGVALAARS